MNERTDILRLDGEEFPIDSLSERARNIALRIKALDHSFKEKDALMTALVLGHRALKEELKCDLLAQKTGLDLASLFDGE